MRDNGKITITVAEYKQFLRNDILLDEITVRAKSEEYIAAKYLRAILGIPEKKEDEDE